MSKNAKTQLPDILPIFPLSGVLLLPRGHLPLNIFEPRYLAMIDEALKTHRMIGMIQPQNYGGQDLFEVGCAGRIVSYEETGDGRYLISLEGVSRFKVKKELELQNGFRRIQPDWSDFDSDQEPMSCLDLNKSKLLELLQKYFEHEGLSCDWDAIENSEDEKLITALAMICPFDASEKQVLLESSCCKERAKTFLTMLDMAVKSETSIHTSETHH
ncbi:MAG: LON peptidase substrate-binding domain-containing protein [Pseudomonadota bacterium]